jgi:hypothetical protein
VKKLDACLSKAIELNKNHPDGRYRHFTFLLIKGKIIGWGMNHPGEPNKAVGYPSYSKIHSEIDAYTKNRNKLGKGFEVVNIRLSVNNELRMSQPCGVCQSLLDRVGCTKIIFSTNNGFVTYER